MSPLIISTVVVVTIRSDRFNSLLGAIEVLGELKNLHLVEFRKPPDNLR